ncbi:MAG: glycoside hydrolase [Phycisphaeraceae bacterium]|nr:glycoside hydrolase [Phycisphaeraceae bacterium]
MAVSESTYFLQALCDEAATLGSPRWRPMLGYVARLHERCIHPPCQWLSHPWEEIGPGYCYGPAFGHWDLIHAVLDVTPSEPEHARIQLLNYFANQLDNGMIPGSLWLNGSPRVWDPNAGHPPVWVVAVDQVAPHTDIAFLQQSYVVLQQQIRWFEKHRQAVDGGFFYQDVVDKTWESGIDDGVRFINLPGEPMSCVDATSHMYLLYETSARWATELGHDAASHQQQAERLRDLIQNLMFSKQTGFFHDSWSVSDSRNRCLSHEGIWPIVVGAATNEQAMSVIHDHLLNPKRFFAKHPITSLAMSDARFEMRMWRGPAWNSITYWAALACQRYQQFQAAAQLLEAALDQTSLQFDLTQTIWEFYHPHGQSPQTLERKPASPYNAPCSDYLGHNPMLAMARLFDELT